MEKWLKISLILCAIGLLKSMVPSDHFQYQYLTEFRDLPGDKLVSFFYPQITYWVLGVLLVFLLITDMLRYKPMIIAATVGAIGYYATMRWMKGVETLTVTAFFCAIMGVDFPYLTYIYAKVSSDKYQQVTSLARSALLFGRCFGAILGQLLFMYDAMNAEELIYISLGSKIIALVLIVFFLPSVNKSIYFYQPKKQQNLASIENGSEKPKYLDTPLPDKQNDKEDQELVKFSWKDAKALLGSHLKSAYTNKIVQLWSVWWILLHAGFNVIYMYNQPLWHYIEPERDDIFNGFAEAGLTLFGALGALLAAKLSQPFIEKWAIWIVVICSATIGSFSLIGATTNNVIVSYVMYILMGSVNYFMVTVNSAIVAKHLVRDSFGLIFGINAYIGVILLVLYNFFIVSDTFFSFNPRELYMIFGYFFYVLVVIFASYGIWKAVKEKRVKSV